MPLIGLIPRPTSPAGGLGWEISFNMVLIEIPVLVGMTLLS